MVVDRGEVSDEDACGADGEETKMMAEGMVVAVTEVMLAEHGDVGVGTGSHCGG